MLTRAEEAGYELLITPGQGIKYPQNLAGRKIALIVLMRNDWRVIRLRVDDIIAVINEIQPGDYREIAIL